ncbi:unnamed protein product, partial [Nesidiocoris tenuis]
WSGTPAKGPPPEVCRGPAAMRSTTTADRNPSARPTTLNRRAPTASSPNFGGCNKTNEETLIDPLPKRINNYILELRGNRKSGSTAHRVRHSAGPQLRPSAASSGLSCRNERHSANRGANATAGAAQRLLKPPAGEDTIVEPFGPAVTAASL